MEGSVGRTSGRDNRNVTSSQPRSELSASADSERRASSALLSFVNSLVIFKLFEWYNRILKTGNGEREKNVPPPPPPVQNPHPTTTSILMLIPPDAFYHLESFQGSNNTYHLCKHMCVCAINLFPPSTIIAESVKYCVYGTTLPSYKHFVAPILQARNQRLRKVSNLAKVS